MTVDSYESLYYDKGHEGLQNEIDRLERKNDELENINDKLSSALKSAENKVERLHSIIKEVREYIKEHIRIDDEYPAYMEMLLEEYKELLEILDKVEE